MIFSLQVIWSEGSGLDPLHIPGMEVLVADQPQEGLVSIWCFGLANRWQVFARGHECGGCSVLKTAVTLASHHGHKQVVIGTVQKWSQRRVGLKKTDLGLSNFFDVLCNPI